MTADGDAGPPRPRNPPGTGERLRGELVEAAVRVLAAHGDTERLSIRAVAAQAQVTPPAVYRCFPDRRALVRTAVEDCFSRFEAELARSEQGTADPFEALRRRCRAYVAFGDRQPHLYRVMFGAWSPGRKALGTYGRRPPPRRRRVQHADRLDPALPQRRRTNPPAQPVPGIPAVVPPARHDRPASRQAGDALARLRRNDRQLPGLPRTACPPSAHGMTSCMPPDEYRRWPRVLALVTERGEASAGHARLNRR